MALFIGAVFLCFGATIASRMRDFSSYSDCIRRLDAGRYLVATGITKVIRASFELFSVI